VLSASKLIRNGYYYLRSITSFVVQFTVITSYAEVLCDVAIDRWKYPDFLFSNYRVFGNGQIWW